jgi:diguanylate cyclase (GGDEF)-like protein
MKSRTASEISGSRARMIVVALGLFGLVAPVLTFFLAVSNLPDSVKVFALVVLALGYSLICLWTFQRSHWRERAEPRPEAPPVSAAIEESLQAIGEASEFFGSSLKPADLFRLVSSRVELIFPFSISALFVAAESKDHLQIAQATGPNADTLLQLQVLVDSGLAGMAWVSGEVEMDLELNLERRAMPEGIMTGLRSAIAIPLLHEGHSFAVLVLYTDRPIKPDPELQTILESIGQRVAPLFLSSLSFERTLSNALTDALTRLPNERAFYMVLENQLAESHRSRNERPLTVLSIDIKNFAEANQSFGYAAGDRMLAFTAENLTSQLRKMDFLSRSANDEFLIILPTASEKFAEEIIQRIRQRFASESFAVSETEEIKVWLNIGWATFWQDGETAEQLLQNARVRKQQAKAEEPTKVLWFPKEYVN